MNTINRYALFSVFLAVNIVPISATNVTDLFKKDIAAPLYSLTEAQKTAVYYAEKHDTIQKELVDDIRVLSSICNRIRNRENTIKQENDAQKLIMPLLQGRNKYQDPMLRKDRAKVRFLKNKIQHDLTYIDLIETEHYPYAVKSYKSYAKPLKHFDIQWLEKQKKLQQMTGTQIQGFDKLYAKRQQDFSALFQGYSLKERSPEDQITKLAINRGIDLKSQIKIDNEAISIAKFEQDKTGTPLHFIPQL